MRRKNTSAGCTNPLRVGFGPLFVAALIQVSVAAKAEKVDSVTLENGNVVTGEIKQLDQGKLKYSTDSLGTVFIEWDEITSLTGKAYYRVETAGGRFYLGSIEPGPGSGTLLVREKGRPVQLAADDVVRIRTIKAGFRDKVDSTLAAGYSYAKSSEVEEFTLAYSATMITERHRIDLNLSGRTTDDGEDTTSQWLGSGDFRRWRQDRNYWLATASAEQNDELGVDLRVLAGGGFGRRFWQTNKSKIAAEAGPVINHTENADGRTDTELELLLRGNWEIFVHDTPKRKLDTTLALFPGLTEAGEYRTVFDITFRQELIEDFFWDLRFYHQYDSEVSDENASNSDYGVNTALGFEF
ncbi:MAG: DUF481 domain-containing protein [Gammaproteobacteria bacterium]|nr:DUF481 domain-containing protein [Gammaproteobacteria bacterium]